MNFEQLKGKTTAEALPIIDAATAEDEDVDPTLAATVVAADVFFAEFDRLIPGMRATLLSWGDDDPLLAIRIETPFGIRRAIDVEGDEQMFQSAAEDYLAEIQAEHLGGADWCALLVIGSQIEQSGLSIARAEVA